MYGICQHDPRALKSKIHQVIKCEVDYYEESLNDFGIREDPLGKKTVVMIRILM